VDTKTRYAGVVTTTKSRETTYPPFAVAVDLVVLSILDGVFSALLVQRGGSTHRGRWALPGGFVHIDEDLEDAARRELREETGVEVEARLEQLATYGRPDRDPRQRVVSVAYLAVGADLPQEVQGGTDAVDARWWPVEEALRLDLAFDHPTILGDGVERARAKLEYTDLALSFCPARFTMPELQGVYEAVWGRPLDPRNFTRKVTRAEGFVRETGEERRGERGRPARLFTAGGATALVPPMMRD
jgi:8-oxo-dGTP diphosphatase